MKIHALITMLVLGTSSAAMADGVSVSGHAEWTFGTRPAPLVIRDHRAPVVHSDWYRSPVRTSPWRRGGYYYTQPAPMMLGTNLHFSNDGRTFIPVGLDKGAFRTLRLDGYSGTSLIQQVAIEFEGGRVQVLRDLNRILDGNRPLMIDLDGTASPIVRVVVYGKPYYQSYPYARADYRFAAPSFSVTAL